MSINESLTAHIKKSNLVRKAFRLFANIYKNVNLSGDIPDVIPALPRPTKIAEDGWRLNLIVPTLEKIHVYGGISTALSFFLKLQETMGLPARIILSRRGVSWNRKNSIHPDKYELIDLGKESNAYKQILVYGDRDTKTLPVGANDIFVATAWNTAYIIEPVIRWQAKYYNIDMHSLIYFIQDFEPCFNPWSSRYMLADSTYRSSTPTTAIFNTSILMEYFDLHGYSFAHKFSFDATLNHSLAAYLKKHANKAIKKKQIIIYGRPSTKRNAFELIVMSLKKWSKMQSDIDEWIILSLGEKHPNIRLSNKATLVSRGKVSLEEYARIMLESYLGISLMISPHPSYPPLEMATFGVKTISNTYENKDLSGFNDNIYSLKECTPDCIAECIHEVAKSYTSECDIITDAPFLNSDDNFSEICKRLNTLINPAK